MQHLEFQCGFIIESEKKFGGYKWKTLIPLNYLEHSILFDIIIQILHLWYPI